MEPKPRHAAISCQHVLFFSLYFLLFFQLVSDFIESIYAFGLLGVDIPPEIATVVLFFTPVLLIFFPRPLPFRAVLVLAGMAALLHALEVTLDPRGKMIASGLAVGILFALLPALFSLKWPAGKEAAGQVMAAGLTVGLVFSILLRTLGRGSDAGLLYPWINWVTTFGMVLSLALLWREPVAGSPPEGLLVKVSPARVLLLCVGVMGSLVMLYFAFASPVVLARWSEVDYRLVLLFLGAALVLYFAGLSNQRSAWFSRPLVLARNGLFLLSGLAAILLSQVNFPLDPSAYPIDQPALGFWQQLPLFGMIVFSPVVLLDFRLMARELLAENTSPRWLAGGFSLGALFFVWIVFTQVFTTIYDYFPVIGPLFRDRFWLVFLMAGAGMALPVLMVRTEARSSPAGIVRAVFFPLVLAVLLISVLWAVMAEPGPGVAEKGETVRVLTYNLQQGYDAGGKRNYEGQLEVIRSLKPDIIGLQETDVARFSGGNADLVRTIAEGLGMHAYYGPRTVTGTFGIALLTRYPLVNPRTFFMFSQGEQTAAIEAEISMNGKDYHILVTHLGNGGPLIQQQQVLERLAGQQRVIAMGDFNFKASTQQYALTTKTLSDAWVAAGSPVVPGLDVTSVIDHMFVSPEVRVRSARYVPSPASDHPALLVEIAP